MLGAGGTIAPAIVHDLAESDEVGGWCCSTSTLTAPPRSPSSHGAGKATARAADARDADALAALLQGADVLVNTASYRINLEAMRACLGAGAAISTSVGSTG